MNGLSRLIKRKSARGPFGLVVPKKKASWLNRLMKKSPGCFFHFFSRLDVKIKREK